MSSQIKASDEKYCSDCGKIIKVKAEICPGCGCRQSAVQLKNGRNRVSTALFALLLGGIGAHKFYLGKFGVGLLYILFCWTLIPGIISFIEGIRLICMSDNEFVNKYS
ncbi:TM2 domain-containing protein [Fluviispira vulneris]|uniref:TM2 domain-containing protein n=1 Tax=Fluviispira vulneris TaxID=2763012 RepID=UPI0016481CB2|nr:TM2 domain-containing protein [Fluviispira vulneris]